MKRLTSVLLAMVLALSLTAPALAAEDTDPPLWKEYGYASREECIRDSFYGDEDAYQEEVEYALARESWEASMAEEIAAFDANAYWNSGECWQAGYYDSKEAFMEDWLLETEEDFRECLLEEWLDSQWWDYWDGQRVERTRAQLGGVAGQVGVMVDGTYVQFPDAVPEVVNGRTMVPCRQVLEAFGGTVTYENGEAVCRLEGVTMRFKDGRDTAAMTLADGTETIVQMDVPCYYKNGRTYIPVRFFAEALGCDVLWDGAYDTAVILRRDKITAELDSRFTVLNRFLEAMRSGGPGDRYKTTAKLEGDLTMLDSINGNQTYRFSADMELLASGTTVNFTAKLKLGDLAKLMAAAGMLGDEDLAQLAASLKDARLEVIYDGEGGMMYMKVPGLSQLTYGTYDDGSWLAAPVTSLAELESAGVTTVGGALYENELAYAKYGTPVLVYGELMEAADELASYVGDDCFQSNGGYSVLRYDKADYEAALAAEGGEEYAQWASEFDKLDLELKIARSGDATFRVLVQNKDSGYGDVALVDASGSVSATRVNMQLLLRLKNQFDLNLRYTATAAPSTARPVTAPPAGATVIDPYEGEDPFEYPFEENGSAVPELFA